MLPKTSGMQYWLLSAVTGLAANKGEEIFCQLENEPMIAALGIVDGENVDIERLYNAVKPAAAKMPASLVVPYVGTFTLNGNDVDKIYNYILTS